MMGPILICNKVVNHCPDEYFPVAHNNTVSIWEDESLDFDVLGNDYCATNATVLEYSKVR